MALWGPDILLTFSWQAAVVREIVLKAPAAEHFDVCTVTGVKVAQTLLWQHLAGDMLWQRARVNPTIVMTIITAMVATHMLLAMVMLLTTHLPLAMHLLLAGPVGFLTRYDIAVFVAVVDGRADDGQKRQPYYCLADIFAVGVGGGGQGGHGDGRSDNQSDEFTVHGSVPFMLIRVA